MPNVTPSPAIEVLIAEDSATQAMLLEAVLANAGYRVTVARHGLQALELLGTLHPALIITDIQMPKMDGYELCRAIKGDPRLASIPVILLTSLSQPQDIIRGLECGADNFVIKPFDEHFLLTRVLAVLANAKLAHLASEAGIPIEFAGQRYTVTSDRLQILNLLLSTYETAVNTNHALRKAQDELKAAQDQLIEVEKSQSVGRLAAGVAHEVKNPLAIMEMGVELLHGQVMEGAVPVLAEIKEAVRRANQVITGLMELSSGDKIALQAVLINDLLEKVLRDLEPEIAKGTFRIDQDLCPELPLCRISAPQIEQALSNVLTNALQAMGSAGTLSVTTRSRRMTAAEIGFDAGDRSGVHFREGDPAVILEVRDTGEGIAPEDLSKVFDPFYSTRPTGKGMGLGLTVARKFIELHGGRIAVANQPNGGVVVTMWFRPVAGDS